jgi:cardiolipin synthase
MMPSVASSVAPRVPSVSSVSSLGVEESKDVFQPVASARPSTDVESVLDLAFMPPQGYPSLVAHYPEEGPNKLHVFIDGPEVYTRLFRDIEKAQHHIHITTYLLGHDDFGARLLRLLCEKASQGVAVRVMADPFGSYLWPRSAARDAFKKFQMLEHVTALTGLPMCQRPDHEKIVVVDGQVAYVGSANLVAGTASGEVHDMMLRVKGPLVWQAQSEFLRKYFWRGGKIETDTLTRAQLKERYFPVPKPLAGGLAVQWVQSIPGYNEEIRRVTLDMINHATTTIDVAYPYLTCSVIIHALIAAAKRGVRIRLMTPWLSDYKSCTAATHRWYPSLWAAENIRTYEYIGFNHVKCLIVDDQQVLMGSANGDDLSMYRIFEGSVLIKDAGFARDLRERVFERDIRDSHEITPETFAPTWWESLYGRMCYVFHSLVV